MERRFDPQQWNLFTPIEIKGRVIKNRLMRSAMLVDLADHEGFVTEDNLNWYRRATEGGVGLLITEAMAVHPRGRIFAAQISAFGEERFSGLKRLADEIHAHGGGVLVMPQIHSGGAGDWGYSYGQWDTDLGLEVVNDEDILQIVQAFGEAALLLKRAGFDGVQLHGGHGYLISQFLSRAVNHRTDRWGGSAENRMRFPLEVYRAVREKVGDDFPIGIKMNTADYLKGGNWVGETSKIAKRFAEAGFDFIEMSGGMGFMTELREALRKKVGEKECYFRDAIPAYREAVKGTKTLLGICGGIRTPQVMQELLGEGIDLVSLARPWLSEPNLANRVKAGDLRPARCVSSYRLCNLCLTKAAKESTTCVKFYPGDCLMTCPIGQDNATYFSLVAQRRFEEALAVVKRDNPLASVLSRVCHHPCETICRGGDGEPLGIRNLKRFITDYGLRKGWMTKAEPRVKGGERGKVAIVGSGPTGLSCGFYLAERGYGVTVFEKQVVKGGMLAIGIPRYRLPAEVLEADIRYIESAGVEIRTGMELGKDFRIGDLFKQGYGAVFLAVGTQVGTRLEMEGSGLEGVVIGLDFLRAVNLGERVKIGERVVVIGGGNVAVNAAMTALRMGAKEVQLACLESRGEMPAYEEEVEDAVEEGVVLNVSLGPKRIKGDGKKVRGVEFVRCESVYDREGRFRPVLGKEVVKEIEADTVIIAVGQKADMGYLGKEEGIRLTREGLIEADTRTGETGYRGVFAGGDMVTGSKSVCEAVAAGKEAAELIDRYIQGRSLWRVPREEAYSPFIKIVRPSAFAKLSERILKENSKRVVVADVPVEERRRDFREIVGVMSEEEAVREAKRCLKYDLELEETSAERMAHMGKAAFVLEP